MFIIKGGYHLNYINVLIRGNVNIRSIVFKIDLRKSPMYMQMRNE